MREIQPKEGEGVSVEFMKNTYWTQFVELANMNLLCSIHVYWFPGWGYRHDGGCLAALAQFIKFKLHR